MLTVYKYPLAITDTQVLMLPEDSQILHIAEQNGTAMLWALVNPDMARHEKRIIHIFGTGHPINPMMMRYIGTFPMLGALVFHAFEELE